MEVIRINREQTELTDPVVAIEDLSSIDILDPVRTPAALRPQCFLDPSLAMSTIGGPGPSADSFRVGPKQRLLIRQATGLARRAAAYNRTVAYEVELKEVLHVATPEAPFHSVRHVGWLPVTLIYLWVAVALPDRPMRLTESPRLRSVLASGD
jgi:hypothetical protein